MFVYDKKLQYPVKIAAVNPRLPPSSSPNTAAPTASWARLCGICPSAMPCPSMN